MSGDDDFDRIMARLDAPMTIVTTTDGGEHAGCLVGFQSQVSIEPRGLAVWISKANHTYRVAVLAELFAVHFLTTDHLELARLFGTRSGDDVDKFERCTWHHGPGGVPVLDDCGSVIVGRKIALVETNGDHVCVMLHPIESECGSAGPPLRLSDVSDFHPGHEAEERPHPSTTRVDRLDPPTGTSGE